jgi:hypothetical protein
MHDWLQDLETMRRMWDDVVKATEPFRRQIERAAEQAAKCD